MLVTSRKWVACGSAVLFVAMSGAAWAAPSGPGQSSTPASPSANSTGEQARPADQGRSNEHGQEARTDQKAQSEGEHGKSAKTPEGFVLLDERVIFLTANEPQNHFLRAHEELATGDNHAASAEIRIAADYLDMQASRKDAQDGQGLRDEAQSLRKLAGEVVNCKGKLSEKSASAGKEAVSARSSSAQENGSCSMQDVDEAFAAANLRLAQAFHDEAGKALGAKKFVRAGHELGDAATCFEQALAWSGQKPQQDRQQTIAGAYLAANALVGADLYSAEKGQASAQAGPARREVKKEAKDVEQDAQKISQALGREIDQFQQQWARNNPGAGQNEATVAGHHESGSGSSEKSNSQSGPGNAEKK